MAKRRIYDRQRHAQFVTFSCYRRRRLLNHDRAKAIVLGTLSAQLRRLAATCIGFVVMPNHVHALLWCAESGEISELMKQWKRTSSVRIRRLLGETLTSYAQELGDCPIWQAKYYAFNVYSRRKLEEKLAYMHQNPVRAGLVKRACDWPWSSARHYEQGKSVGVKLQCVD